MQKDHSLVSKLTSGNRSKVNQLVKANARFVPFIANKYKGLVSDGLFDDLISLGFIGMLKAAERFDDSKGLKFIAYAEYWIKSEIISFLKKEKKACHDSSLSLDSPIGGETDDTFAEIIPDPKTTDFQRIKTLQTALNMIAPVERRVLTLEFVENFTQKEIAAIIKVPIAEINRIRGNGINQLKNALQVLTINERKKVTSKTDAPVKAPDSGSLYFLWIPWVMLSLDVFKVSLADRPHFNKSTILNVTR